MGLSREPRSILIQQAVACIPQTDRVFSSRSGSLCKTVCPISANFALFARMGVNELSRRVDEWSAPRQGDPCAKSGLRKMSERARTLARLAEAERQYRALVEHAVEGVFRTSPDGRFVMANASLARMLGYESPEQLIAERADLERHHYVSP